MRAAKIAIIGLVLTSLLMCSFVTGIVGTALFMQTRSGPLAQIAATADGSTPSEMQDRFRIFWEAWRITRDNYVDEKVIDNQRMTYGAIQGMLDTLGDQGHTTFRSPQEAQRNAEWITSTFSGIGAEVTQKDNRPVIVTPMEGAPAERAGIKPNDVIMKIDGVDTIDMTLDDAVTRIRGQEGTQVALTIFRPASNQTLDITVTRGKITEQIVTWIMLPGTTTAYVKLNKFSQNATRDLQAAIQAAQKAGAKNLVFDLRNNPGGLLSEGIAVPSQFLPQGTVVLKERRRGGETKDYPAQRGGVALDIPMVVLINQGSASAAEITSGALQFHNRAKLVGVTTFGTGTILSTFKLSDGSELVLGTAEWLTPGGRMIRRQGIEPDVRVELPPDAQMLTPNAVRAMTPEQFQANTDAQLMEALRLLNEGPKP